MKNLTLLIFILLNFIAPSVQANDFNQSLRVQFFFSKEDFTKDVFNMFFPDLRLLFSVKKESSRSTENSAHQKHYLITAYSSQNPKHGVIQLGSPIQVTIPVHGSQEQVQIQTNIPCEAVQFLDRTRRTANNILRRAPFYQITTNRLALYNRACKIGTTNPRGNVKVNLSNGYSLTPSPCHGQDRRLIHADSDIVEHHEVTMINVQFVFIVASMMNQMHTDNPALAYEAALMMTYLWGHEQGFPNILQSYQIGGYVFPHGYSMSPSQNSGIQNFFTLVADDVVSVHFNQPFPPHMHMNANWNTAGTTAAQGHIHATIAAQGHIHAIIAAQRNIATITTQAVTLFFILAAGTLLGWLQFSS